MTFREVLSIVPIRRLWLAQLVSVFGDFLAIFAVFSVATFRLHANAAQLSMLMVSYMLPLAVVSPLAGVLVDRWNLKRTMIASDLIRALIACGLIFATRLEHFYAIFVCLSIVSAFFVPAQSVAVRLIVPAEGLMTANALMAQAMQVTQIVTPAIAGILVDTVGANLAYGFDVASYFFSAAMVYGVSFHREPHPAKSISMIHRDMTEGLKFIFTHSAVSFVMIAMTVGMFAIRSFGALMAVYVRDVLTATSSLFGVLNSMIGLGMIVATQVIHRTGKDRPKKNLVVFGLAVSGCFIAFLAALGTVPTTFIGMLGLGFGVAFVFIPAQTLLQQVTPTEMLGRVSSSMMSSLAFTQVVALTLAGSLAHAIGIRNLYFCSAALLLLLAFSGYRRLSAAADSRVPVSPDGTQVPISEQPSSQ